MSQVNFQEQFIGILKQLAPPSINLAAEIASILNLSNDAAYRRLRGASEFSLNETFILCNHFEIPLDALNNEVPNVVNFRINKLEGTEESFLNYLNTLNTDLSKMFRYENYSLRYAAEDLPVFYHFYFPKLIAFKVFYWNKSLLYNKEVQNLTVEQFELPDSWKEVCEKLASTYSKMPSTEIWNVDTIKSTLQQIQFYLESGFFEKKETAYSIIEELEMLIKQIKLQCENGRKITPQGGILESVAFEFYSSEIMIGNNCVQINCDNKLVTYVGYNSFNFMRTGNSYFNEQSDWWFNNLMNKSTLISKVAEKSRNQFFKKTLDQIENLKKQIELF